VTGEAAERSEGLAAEPVAGLVRVWADVKGRRQYSVSVRVGETLDELRDAKNIALAVADELAQEMKHRDEVET